MQITIKSLSNSNISLPAPLPNIKKGEQITRDITPEDFFIIKNDLDNLINQRLIDIISIELSSSYANNFTLDDDGGSVNFQDIPITGGGGGAEEVRTLYVGKHGDNGNDGNNIEAALLTINAAITAAVALTPTSANPVVIRIADAGKYNEHVILPAYISLYGPNATVEYSSTNNDAVEANNECYVRLRKVICSGTNGFCLVMPSSAVGSAYFMVNNLVATGFAANITNRAAGSTRMVVKCDIIETAYRGIEAKATAEIQFNIGALLLTANNANGIINGFSANFIGRIGVIKKIGAITGTKAVTGSSVLIIEEIDAETAWQIGGGSTLDLVVSKVSGIQKTLGGGIANVTIAGQGVKSKNWLQSTSGGVPSVTISNAIPAGAILVGLKTLVTIAITGATSFDIGDDVPDVDRWGAALSIILSSTSDNTDWTDTAIKVETAARDIILTANGGNFTGGEVSVTAYYISL